jgi:peptide deformylase
VSVREIRLLGDPILKTKTKPVRSLEDARQLVGDLLETVALPGRAGVAANQIGVGLSVFAYNIDGELGYLINPEITFLGDDRELIEEGCLSVPGLWHRALRHKEATATGFQLDGSKITISGSGLMAQALQHECDHLAGKTYLDRLEPTERKIAYKELRSQKWFLG